MLPFSSTTFASPQEDAPTLDKTYQIELLKALDGPDHIIPALSQALEISADDSLSIFNSLPKTLGLDLSQEEILRITGILIKAGAKVLISPTPCLRIVDYSVTLVSYGTEKNEVMQEIGQQLHISKPVARALVESAPTVIAEELTKDEANILSKQLRKRGAEMLVQVQSKCTGAIKVVNFFNNPCGNYSKMTILSFENKSDTRKTIYQHVSLSMKEIQILLRELPATLSITIEKKVAHDLAIKLQEIGTEVKIRRASDCK
jgi:ribosomal protein L7/L12